MATFRRPPCCTSRCPARGGGRHGERACAGGDRDGGPRAGFPPGRGGLAGHGCGPQCGRPGDAAGRRDPPGRPGGCGSDRPCPGRCKARGQLRLCPPRPHRPRQPSRRRRAGGGAGFHAHVDALCRPAGRRGAGRGGRLRSGAMPRLPAPPDADLRSAGGERHRAAGGLDRGLPVAAVAGQRQGADPAHPRRRRLPRDRGRPRKAVAGPPPAGGGRPCGRLLCRLRRCRGRRQRAPRSHPAGTVAAAGGGGLRLAAPARPPFRRGGGRQAAGRRQGLRHRRHARLFRLRTHGAVADGLARSLPVQASRALYSPPGGGR